MSREVTSDQFVEMKQRLAHAESAVKRVQISSISVDAKELAHGYIRINGNQIGASAQFFRRLGAMLKINTSLTRNMIEKGDTAVAAALINGLRDYKSTQDKNTEVIVIANLATRELVDICEPSRYRRVTNDTLFDVTERIMNENSNLIIESIDHNPNNGNLSVNLLNNQEVGFGAGKDEFFKFGFSIIQTSKDTLAESYNQRLVCSNGLRVSLGQGAIGGNNQIQFNDKFRLGGTGAEDIRTFLNQVEAMNKAGFVPAGFEDAINRAVGTRASYLEVDQALKTSLKHLNDPDTEILKQYKNAVGRQWFHAHADTEARLMRKGVDAHTLSDRQKQFIKTGMSVWDVVNSLTSLGSNNHGYPMNNQHELKYEGGNLFAKGTKEGFDLEFAQYATL